MCARMCVSVCLVRVCVCMCWNKMELLCWRCDAVDSGGVGKSAVMSVRAVFVCAWGWTVEYALLLYIRFWTLDKSCPPRVGGTHTHTDIPYNKWKIRKTYSKLYENALARARSPPFGCSVHLIQASDAGVVRPLATQHTDTRIWGYLVCSVAASAFRLRRRRFRRPGYRRRCTAYFACLRMRLAFGYVVLTLAKNGFHYNDMYVVYVGMYMDVDCEQVAEMERI